MIILYWSIFSVFVIISFFISKLLYLKLEKLSVDSFSGMTGKEVVEKMLKDKNIRDVRVERKKGILTNFYTPFERILMLSESVYYGKSIYIKALAAHESGHIIQHAVSYKGLILRSRLMPFVKYLSKCAPWIVLAGLILLLINDNLGIAVILGGIISYIFSIVSTLIAYPVEYNASKRAIQWLDYRKFTSEKETEMVKFTLVRISKIYILMTLLSFATLAYYFSRIFEIKSKHILEFSKLL